MGLLLLLQLLLLISMVSVSQYLEVFCMEITLSPEQLFLLLTQLVFISIQFGKHLLLMSGFITVVLTSLSFVIFFLVYVVIWDVSGNFPSVLVCVLGLQLHILLQ